MSSDRVRIHKLSPTAALLRMTFEGIEIATGSGFFYSHEDKLWLVTAKHCLTGEDPRTGESLSKVGNRPDGLIADYCHFPAGGPANGKRLELNLYRNELRTQSDWIMHADSEVDVAAVELESVALEDRPRCVNDDGMDYVDFAPEAGDGAFVLGYPRGLTALADDIPLPLWKRATIANDPAMSRYAKGRIYVDTATRRGMSGAPTFAERVGVSYPIGFEGQMDRMVIGQALRFLGVYTSREQADDSGFMAQIGNVFLEEAIIEVLTEQFPGQGIWA